MKRFWMLSFAILACGDTEETDTSVNLVPANVQTIFTDHCALSGCHAGSSPAQGQNLSESRAYGSIVNVTAQQSPSKKRIAPGDTTNSYMFEKIKGTGGISGDRMPLGGPYLTVAQIDTIRQWILLGAPPR